jgi:hypothetical protein
MYIKVNEETTVFPYDIKNLKKENPNTVFPDKLNEDALNSFGVFTVRNTALPTYNKLFQRASKRAVWVEEREMPEVYDEELDETIPGYTDPAHWELAWDINQLQESQAIRNLREARDKVLNDTDWVVVKAQETNTVVDPALLQYRQDLRDITDQVGFPYIELPTPPG